MYVCPVHEGPAPRLNLLRTRRTFTQVLNISEAEAEFYLSSANYDLAVAVSLFLDTSSDNQQARRRRTGPQYDRQIEIVGLPEGWTSYVSSYKWPKKVYFRHIETGTEQLEDPDVDTTVGFPSIHDPFHDEPPPLAEMATEDEPGSTMTTSLPMAPATSPSPIFASAPPAPPSDMGVAGTGEAAGDATEMAEDSL